MTTKAIFTALMCCFFSFAKGQFAYISTNGNIILESGSIEEYDTPDIYCDGTYSTIGQTWNVTLQLTAPSAGASAIIKTHQLQFTKATVDSYTPGTASGETETIQNVILQAVKDYLDNFNGGITFTLH